MPHVMLPNLQLVFFFVCFIIKNFKKALMRHLAMGSIVVYSTTIISNILNKMVDCMELRVVESWLI